MVSDYLDDRGPHPLEACAREIPRFRLKRELRTILDLAIPNVTTNALLMMAPMRDFAQRVYFHRRGGDPADFEAWSRAFENDDFEPVGPSAPPSQLTCI